MKSKEILDQEIDVFKSSNKSSHVYFSSSMINFFTELSIKSKDKINYMRKIDDEEKQKEYKKTELIGATLSATFNKRRVVGCVKDKTGVIAIDIDKDKNPDLDIDKVKNEVMKLPYVFLVMKSCRGEGIFCLVYYNKDNYIGYVFNALKKEFKKLGYVIDDSCSDITRLRIVSYDDNILIKDEVERYDDYLEEEYKEYNCEGDWILTKEDLKDLVCVIYVLVNYNGYTSNDYNEWLLDGFRLATIPNRTVGLKLFEMISQGSDNYKGYDDVKEKFDECCRTTRYTTNILGYYINKIKEIYGDKWRYKIKDLLKEKGARI